MSNVFRRMYLIIKGVVAHKKRQPRSSRLPEKLSVYAAQITRAVILFPFTVGWAVGEGDSFVDRVDNRERILLVEGEDQAVVADWRSAVDEFAERVAAQVDFVLRLVGVVGKLK